MRQRVHPSSNPGLKRRAICVEPARSMAAYANSSPGRSYGEGSSSRPPPPRRSSGLPPSDWFTPKQRFALERRAVLPPPPGLVEPVETALRPAKRSTPLLAVLLECLDAGALLGSVGGAAAAIVTEQLTFCLLPLTLPVLALLAGRAARGVREERAQEELAVLVDQVRALSAQARGRERVCWPRQPRTADCAAQGNERSPGQLLTPVRFVAPAGAAQLIRHGVGRGRDGRRAGAPCTAGRALHPRGIDTSYCAPHARRRCSR